MVVGVELDGGAELLDCLLIAPGLKSGVAASFSSVGHTYLGRHDQASVGRLQMRAKDFDASPKHQKNRAE